MRRRDVVARVARLDEERVRRGGREPRCSLHPLASPAASGECLPCVRSTTGSRPRLGGGSSSCAASCVYIVSKPESSGSEIVERNHGGVPSTRRARPPRRDSGAGSSGRRTRRSTSRRGRTAAGAWRCWSSVCSSSTTWAVVGVIRAGRSWLCPSPARSYEQTRVVLCSFGTTQNHALRGVEKPLSSTTTGAPRPRHSIASLYPPTSTFLTKCGTGLVAVSASSQELPGRPAAAGEECGERRHFAIHFLCSRFSFCTCFCPGRARPSRHLEHCRSPWSAGMRQEHAELVAHQPFADVVVAVAVRPEWLLRVVDVQGLDPVEPDLRVHFFYDAVQRSRSVTS